MNEKKDKIGDYLVKHGYLTVNQIDKILKRQALNPEKRFGEIALELGFISNDIINEYLAYVESK